jgi:hypothetical protein
MHEVLMSKNMKPYGKLGHLIHYAHQQGIISAKEYDGFDAELDLLLKGLNRSHNTIPRTYIEENEASSNTH